VKKRTGINSRQKTDGTWAHRAEAFDAVTGKRVYETFDNTTAAVNWRRDMQVKIARGEVRAIDPTTIADAWALWLVKAKAGVIRSRGGELYKPGVIHTYELSFTGRLLDKFGTTKVGALKRVQIQRYVDELIAEPLAAQTVRNNINALRVLLKWCVREELIAVNPCDGLELPSGGVPRDNITPPSEAISLLAALEPVDRAIYATAFFAGLRRGELMGLRWGDVDLENNEIRVRQCWDPSVREFVAPKSKKGVRDLGIPEILEPYLIAAFREHRPGKLAFANAKGRPFVANGLAKRARAAWGHQGTGLHEARHTYASLMIAAGVNIKTISEWMGHSSVTITLDRYGHLLPGSAAAALGLLNDYLTKELS
jgi:integrase